MLTTTALARGRSFVAQVDKWHRPTENAENAENATAIAGAGGREYHRLMHKLSTCLLRFAALTAWAAMALGQTPAMLTLHVKTPDGLAVQNADVTFQSAQPPESVQGRQVNKFGLQAQAYRPFFVTKTNADGQAQPTKAGLENAFPAGRVVVSVRAAGYEPYRQTFELADPKPLEIVLRPLPPQQ